MNSLLYQPAEHRRRIHKKIDWPELVFYAEGAGEPFQELTITTLKSDYVTLCQERAMHNICFFADDRDWFTRVKERSVYEMNSGVWKVREYVRVDDNYNVHACIDADAVTDTEVDIILARLEETPMPGEKFFSDPRTFTFEEIQDILYNETATE